MSDERYARLARAMMSAAPAEVPPISPEHARILFQRADEILTRGTLVFDQKRSTVAYAFVVPIDLRDDLADIISDIELAADETSPETHETAPQPEG